MTAEPGDLILVKSTGRFYAAGRWIGGNPYDHIAVVVSGGNTLNIDKPQGRLLPAQRLVAARLSPLVLRPAWASPADRDAFVAWIESLAGRPYDVRRTLRLVARLIVRRLTRIALPLERPTPNATHWICTDAVLLGLERHLAHFDRAAALPLDWHALHAGTTNDFLVISEKMPDLIGRVGP